MMEPDDIKALVERGIPGSTVEVANPQADGRHFSILVIADAFEGKGRVQQHQMVYQALGDAMSERIHALQVRTFTPAQWRDMA
jgi:acid stress-induced BolA-like protein IbaG/YrbA